MRNLESGAGIFQLELTNALNQHLSGKRRCHEGMSSLSAYRGPGKCVRLLERQQGKAEIRQ